MSPPSSVDHSASNPVDPETVRRLVVAGGFDRAGFAAAGPAPSRELFRRWLARGFAAGMDYLKKRVERRSDPRSILPGASSIIVTSLQYRDASPFGIARGRGDRAEIASYARGTDYHRVVETRLRAVCATLAREFPAKYRYYVDTGPVLERDWAQLAGIGWVGKNTCTIDRETGSFFFLGVIITTLSIEPDTPATNHCGSCRRCLEACPTDAFVQPYELDARRCISYLNIEHRGEIPEELEPKIGNLVFGCDICQEVCPYNRRSPEVVDEELRPRPETSFPPLAELAQLDRKTFRDRFPRSAIRRAKFEGFLRNVIVALANSERVASLRVLENLQTREDIVRDEALRATLERAIARLEHRLAADR